MVFTNVQNLVGIHAAVLIIWKFEYTFLFKMSIHPPKLSFWGFDPLNREVYQKNPKRQICAWKDVIRLIDLLCTCQRDKEKKETLQWQTGYSHRPPTSSDRNTVWHGGWSSGSSTHTHTTILHNHFTALVEYVRDHLGEQVPER